MKVLIPLFIALGAVIALNLQDARPIPRDRYATTGVVKKLVEGTNFQRSMVKRYQQR